MSKYVINYKQNTITMTCTKCNRVGHNKRTCKSKLHTESKKECIICYEPITCGEVRTKCGHLYCYDCFAKDVKHNRCAYCRQALDMPVNKTLDEEDKRAIVEKCILDDYTFDDIYRDFYRQILNSMKNNANVNKYNQTHIQFICQELLDDVTLDYGLVTMGMKICDAVCDSL
jgi:hypothetical protein